MAKHDKSKQEKVARNELYARKYRQLKCKQCGHKSCKPGRCVGCGAPGSDRKLRGKP